MQSALLPTLRKNREGWGSHGVVVSVEGWASPHYNNIRLNSALGYITPKDMLAGNQQEIQAERDRKLEGARKQRQIRRQQAA